jgi:hypothetical protein
MEKMVKGDMKMAKGEMKGEKKAKGDMKMAKGEMKGEKKALSPWMKFVMDLRKKHPNKSYKEVLQMASKEYKK